MLSQIGKSGLTRSLKWRGWLGAVLRFLSGADVFISYSRKDAFEYAANLASLLGQRGLRVYLDQVGAPPGMQVPGAILKAARHSSVMVLLESQGACSSDAVGQEVAAFPVDRRPVVRVQFNEVVPNTLGSAEPLWRRRLSGLAIQKEDAANLLHATPVPALIERIDRTVGNHRQTRRLRTAGLLVGAMLAIGILALTFTYAQLFRVRRDAQDIGEQNRNLATQVTRIQSDLRKGRDELQSLRTQTSEQERLLRAARQRTALETRRARDQLAATESVWDVVEKTLEDVQREIDQPNLSSSVSGLSLEPPLTILFGPRKYAPTNAARELLTRLAECWRRLPNPPALEIVGHAALGEVDLGLANTAAGTYTPEYALALGDRRAAAAREFLVQMGLSGDRLRSMSMGGERPRFQSELMNNRVEIRVGK